MSNPQGKSPALAVQTQVEKMIPEFAKVAGRSMDPVRLARIAMTAWRNEPKLAEDMQSFLSCIMIAAVLRLEPGVMGLSYLIPYYSSKKNTNICTFIPGWAGHVDLVNRAGKAAVRTIAIREGDEFDYQLGTRPKVHFKPSIDNDEDRPLIATCSIGHVLGMDDYPQIEVHGFEKVRKHLLKYNKVGERHYALQTGNNLQTSHNFEMYARKIPLLQVVKYVPKSIEWAVAANLEYATDSPTVALNAQVVSRVLDGEPIESIAASGDVEDLQSGESELITDVQAKQFFDAYRASGYTVQEVSGFLKSKWDVTDSRKIPAGGFDEAMRFASAKIRATAPATTTQNFVAPTLDQNDPQMKRLTQLFEIHDVPAKMQGTFLYDYAGKVGELISRLESELPE